MENLPREHDGINWEFGGSEIVGPFYVELMMGGTWDLWAECEDLASVREEVEVLRSHGFRYRVTDETDHNLSGVAL